jgi:hypothetical protein
MMSGHRTTEVRGSVERAFFGRLSERFCRLSRAPSCVIPYAPGFSPCGTALRRVLLVDGSRHAAAATGVAVHAQPSLIHAAQLPRWRLLLMVPVPRSVRCSAHPPCCTRCPARCKRRRVRTPHHLATRHAPPPPPPLQLVRSSTACV